MMSEELVDALEKIKKIAVSIDEFMGSHVELDAALTDCFQEADSALTLYEQENTWTPEWPTTAGFYWFYGYRYGIVSCRSDCEPELILVEAQKGSSGMTLVGNGQFLYESEPEDARFVKFVSPKLPDLPGKDSE